MAVSVKKVALWRGELEDRPGGLDRVLEPLAGTNLTVVMGYRPAGQRGRAVVELAPITGQRATALAQGAGLATASIPTLLVEGDDRRGLGHDLASAIAGAGINLGFLVALVTGRRYSAVFGFENEDDAARGATLIKQAARSRKPTARARPKARRRGAAKKR